MCLGQQSYSTLILNDDTSYLSAEQTCLTFFFFFKFCTSLVDSAHGMKATARFAEFQEIKTYLNRCIKAGVLDCEIMMIKPGAN